MWNKFTKKIKRETIKNGVYIFNTVAYEYNISYQLIKNGRKNKIFNKIFKFKNTLHYFMVKKMM